MDFTTLPHKLLQPEQFEQQILQLRTRFVDSKDQSFVFKPIYHKRIPADGFAPYLSSIWVSHKSSAYNLIDSEYKNILQEQVLTNKDLDLPTQQELLAQFRCDEIASTAFETFQSNISKYRQPIDAGSVLEELGSGMTESRASAIAQFDAAASRYHVGVYQRKRSELLAKMNASLSPLFVGQLKNLHKNIVKDYKSSMAAAIKTEGYDFGTLIKQANQKAEEQFIKQATCAYEFRACSMRFC